MGSYCARFWQTELPSAEIIWTLNFRLESPLNRHLLDIRCKRNVVSNIKYCSSEQRILPPRSNCTIPAFLQVWCHPRPKHSITTIRCKSTVITSTILMIPIIITITIIMTIMIYSNYMCTITIQPIRILISIILAIVIIIYNNNNGEQKCVWQNFHSVLQILVSFLDLPGMCPSDLRISLHVHIIIVRHGLGSEGIGWGHQLQQIFHSIRHTYPPTYITLHYIPFHSIPFHYITLHYIHICLHTYVYMCVCLCTYIIYIYTHTY